MAQEKVIMIGVGVITAVLGSLIGYVFYGFINLSAEVRALRPVIEQIKGEQDDIWNKYNKNQDDKTTFIIDYYQFKVEQEKIWVEFYREKTK